MDKIAVLGFTSKVLTRILESLSVHEEDVLIVLNQKNEEWEKSVTDSGLNWINIKDIQSPEKFKWVLGVLKPDTKNTVVQDFIEMFPNGLQNFRSAIHPFSSISQFSRMGVGNFTEPGLVIGPHTEIGNFVSINRNCSIGHHTRIGDFCMINPGVNVAGECNIGEKVSIGMGTNIFDGISIGDNTVIGAGSMVNKDLPAGVMAYGNPCKVIKNLNLA